ncbi:signal peptidase II [Isobaculum melis]|uniref:Lipoprotein signal peptidase n=1 Tax=Isobaculum melis TaxID=142588 RepID=A0A1H9T0T4_9LACT|nr:signal peptidase II [Isobaculum melis]SER90845.1 signal peptidase II Aspartic peptidase. MEROPS family A08 [Isobaculum melis]
MLYYYIGAILFIGIDQLTKYIVMNQIDLYHTIEVIPNILSWTYVKNEGAAWNILEGKMWLFYIITTIVIIAILYIMQKYAKPRKNLLLNLSLMLILAGAIGNFIDRLVHTFVVDMIQLTFFNFPVFNVADMCLTVGVALAAIYIIKDESLNN